jgi:hypothetical protein
MRWASSVAHSLITKKTICPGLSNFNPSSFEQSLQRGGKILETLTRLKGAMAASLRASSKLANFSLCCPFPLVKNTLDGMIMLMSYSSFPENLSL